VFRKPRARRDIPERKGHGRCVDEAALEAGDHGSRHEGGPVEHDIGRRVFHAPTDSMATIEARSARINKPADLFRGGFPLSRLILANPIRPSA
jgi:hypothetical protein